MNKIHYTISFCFDDNGEDLNNFLEKYFIAIISNKLDGYNE